MIIPFLAKVTNSTTEVTVYKLTHDLSNVDYLHVTCAASTSAGTFTVKVYFDADLKKTMTFTSASRSWNDGGTIDCTAISNEKAIKVVCYVSNVAYTGTLDGFLMYPEEA